MNRLWLSLLLGLLGVALAETHTYAGEEIPASEAVGPLFPSVFGKDRLPDGFLLQDPRATEVYVIQGGKKSLVHRPLLDRWLKEAHYFKQDVIVKVSAAELARYSSTTPRNIFAMGRILTVGGQRYFISDTLRRRPISPAVQAALKYPRRNVYKETSRHWRKLGLRPLSTRFGATDHNA